MGKIEQGVRRRAQKQNIQKAILSVVGVAGVLAVGMAAPNALKILDYTPLGHKKSFYRANTSLRRLIERGFIISEMKSGRHVVRLTSKGTLQLARLSGEQSMKRRWDKQWRIVIFDISERNRNVRDSLRHTLFSIGFRKLQESVWIYPYDCEDLITLIKTHFSIGTEVLYIVSEHVEGDTRIRKIFDLS